MEHNGRNSFWERSFFHIPTNKRRRHRIDSSDGSLSSSSAALATKRNFFMKSCFIHLKAEWRVALIPAWLYCHTESLSLGFVISIFHNFYYFLCNISAFFFFPRCRTCFHGAPAPVCTTFFPSTVGLAPVNWFFVVKISIKCQPGERRTVKHFSVFCIKQSAVVLMLCELLGENP